MLLRKAAAAGLVFVASATSTGSTIVIPSSAAAGDLGFLYDAASDSAMYPSTTTPSGWTATNVTYFGTNLYTRVTSSRKKLASGDPGATITGMTADTSVTKILLIFRKTPAIGTITAYEVVNDATDGDPAAQSKATQTAPYVVLGGCFSENSLPTWASTWYDESFTNGYMRLAYKIFNASPATVSIDIGDSGDANFLQSCSLKTS